jgi:hypothetical protein
LAFREVVFKNLIGNHVDVDADVVDSMLLFRAGDDPLLEIINHGWR